MENKNLNTAIKYYEAWETGNRDLLKVSPDLKLVSPDDTFNSAEEFFEKCWQASGVPLLNKQFVSEGNTVCVRYEIKMPDGSLKPFCEWLVFEDGMIKEIQVYYDRG